MASNQKQEGKTQDSSSSQKKKGWSFGSFWKNSPPKEGDAKENSGLPIKNLSKNFEKFGNYAKNLAKEIKTNVSSQLVTGMGFGDPVWGDLQATRIQDYEETKVRENNKRGYEEEYSDEEEFDDEDQEEEYYEEYEEEEDNRQGEGEEDEESEEEEEGYEEEEGSLEDEEEEEEEEAKEKTVEPERSSMDDFAIDDDESPPIQHPNPDSKEKVPEEKKQKEPRRKKSKKKKTKKGKGKSKDVSKPQAGTVNREEQMSEDLVLEDVYVNRNYVLGDMFTDFHQFYFKGDYLDYEPEDFYKATLATQKTGITNMLFQETRYLSVQDNILYITEMETVEDYKLALVLESYPLSRLVKFERIDKKKRVILGFYTEESNSQNPQREVTFEVKNYSKFLKVMSQSLTTVNSSFHLLSFNIE